MIPNKILEVKAILLEVRISLIMKLFLLGGKNRLILARSIYFRFGLLMLDLCISFN